MATWLALALGLAACGGPERVAGPTPAPPPAPPAPPTLPTVPAPPAGPAGAWSSPGCGEARTYPRALRLDPDGTWAGRDLVSPCPPDVTCVWSGIVERRGTWRDDGGAARLELGEAAPAPAPGDPFPTRLERAGDALVDDLGCRYAAVPALP